LVAAVQAGQLTIIKINGKSYRAHRASTKKMTATK
jgi:hypothetical protein